MKFAYGCVIFAAFMPYIFAFLAKAGGAEYNNKCPREYLSTLTGWRQRANWVQLNSFEAFPIFAAAIIIAGITHVSQTLIDQLAFGFIIARTLYGICYVLDKPTFRSLAWFGGFGCSMALLVLSIPSVL